MPLFAPFVPIHTMCLRLDCVACPAHVPCGTLALFETSRSSQILCIQVWAAGCLREMHSPARLCACPVLSGRRFMIHASKALPSREVQGARLCIVSHCCSASSNTFAPVSSEGRTVVTFSHQHITPCAYTTGRRRHEHCARHHRAAQEGREPGPRLARVRLST